MKVVVGQHNYYVYILTNKNKTVLYTGYTGNLKRRLEQHAEKARRGGGSFVGTYQVTRLIFWEGFKYRYEAIAREDQIKTWSRWKKERLISYFNPSWEPLNHKFASER